jgi:hypothetical protein
VQLVNSGDVLQVDCQGVARDLHSVVRDLHDPENAVGRDARIEVMHL